MKVIGVDTLPIRALATETIVPDRGPFCTTPWDVFASHRRSPKPRADQVLADERPPIESRQRARISNVVVRLRTDEGLDGYGMVGVGSPASIDVIRYHLEPLVLGQDPFDVERTWELMFRRTLNIGRKGLVLEAISAIDIALWDIMGKATGQPVYNLLGGRTRDTIRTYASQLYATDDLDKLHDEAKGYLDAGFTAMKMRFACGPMDGRHGMKVNYDLVRTVRDAVGSEVDLMADVYQGWDVPYAISMIRMLDEFELGWIEEPVIPEDLEGYARIRNSVRTPIAGGEHEFTRYGYRDMIRAGAVDILQPDVNRMGGITEARKVWALAAAHNLPVIPHGPDPHNAHLVMAHMNSPMLEYFPRSADGSPNVSYNLFAALFDGCPASVDGYLDLPPVAGLGITPNADAFEEYQAEWPDPLS